MTGAGLWANVWRDAEVVWRLSHNRQDGPVSEPGLVGRAADLSDLLGFKEGLRLGGHTG